MLIFIKIGDFFYECKRENDSFDNSHRHLLKGKLRREVISKATSIERLRKECDDGAERLANMPEGVTVEIAGNSPIYAEWIKPDEADEAKAILYFHGGGFVMGNVKSHRCIVGSFVKILRCSKRRRKL